MLINPYTLKIYICSTDKTFYYVMDLTKITFENILINTSFSVYTNMEIDIKNKRIF